MNGQRLLIFFVLPLVAAVILITQCCFTVDETESAIVLQLGKPERGPLGPGLYFKLPFIQNAVFFDSRVLDYGSQSAEILTQEKKNMVVDNYAKWRITDPLAFYINFRTIRGAQARLDDIIYAEMRVVLGRYTLNEVVSHKRSEIMATVTKHTNAQLAPFGVEVIDVRIRRTDLPPENERSIFGRMRAERERQAKLYRSEGLEESAKIKSKADMDKTIILAEAQKTAETLRGQGEAESTRIYADAYGQAPDFYAFQRSLDAYRKGFAAGTSIILTPKNSFLQFMK